MNAHKEIIGSHYWDKERIHAKKGKDISIVKGIKRRGMRICSRTIKKGVYQTLEITTNGTYIFCREEGW